MPREARHAMCRGHWVLVSVRTRARVTEAFANRRKQPRVYVLAIRQAIAEVAFTPPALPPTAKAVQEQGRGQ